jgi:hypothetical protein
MPQTARATKLGILGPPKFETVEGDPRHRKQRLSAGTLNNSVAVGSRTIWSLGGRKPIPPPYADLTGDPESNDSQRGPEVGFGI